MSSNTEQFISIREINVGHHVRHYLELLWRKKWYLLVALPLTTITASLIIINYRSVRPELPASIVIGFDNTRPRSAVDDVADFGQKRMELIRSRNFLSGITDSLSLRLLLRDHFRSHIFDDIRIDSTALNGRYLLSIHNDTAFRLLLWNETLGHQGTVVAQGPLSNFSSRSVAGLHLIFTREFLSSPHEITFHVVDTRTAVDNILENLTIDVPRRGQDFFTVTLEGRDYPLTARILNTMAEEFVQQNLAFRKKRTKEVLDVLEKQLETASRELAQSEAALKAYLTENPTVGLDRNAQNTLSSLMALESQGSIVDHDIAQARSLQSRLAQAQGLNRHNLVQEILLFLNTKGEYAAAVLQDELVQLMQEHERLKRSHAPNHPLVLDVSSRIDRLGNRALDALKSFIRKGTKAIKDKENAARNLSEELRSLPQKEMRLVQLQRKREIDADIYSTILSRYNQAKVADAVEMADLFIMDVAVEPVPEPIQLPIALVLGLLFGMVASLGPLVLLDLIDQTVRTEHELKKLIRYPVLQSIPRISIARPKNADQGAGPAPLDVDPHLITSDFAPNFINELFRSLRTKLLLGLHHAPHRSIIVTSLNANEGKSLISSNLAITLAQQSLNTVLIDGDLRRGMLHTTFVAKKNPGLSDFIFSTESISDETISGLTQATHVPNLWLISSGANIPNPSELLSSTRFQEFVGLLVKRYDFVILDTPPIGFASDAVVVNALFSKYLVVARAGSTNIVDLRERIQEYPHMQEKVAGVVLNEASIDRKLKYYKYSNYYY